jgi:hypothetical protein
MLNRSVQESYACPMVCYDVGLTQEQCAEVATHRTISVLPLPDTPLITRIREVMGNAPPLQKVEKRVWPLWICPALIHHAPFKKLLWLDCDVVVMRGLRDLFDAVDRAPVFTPENKAPHLTPNRSELYHLLPIDRHFDPRIPAVNAGVSGWCKLRDADVLLAYMFVVERAVEDREVREAISWHDQGALIWAIQSQGLETCVAETNKWNLCVDHTALSNHPPTWDDNFLERVRAAVPEACIVHWNGRSPPWKDQMRETI